MLGNLLSWFTGGERRRMQAELSRGLQHIRARYDAAQTTDENRNHWAGADSMSAKSANSPAVRSQLRKRARYEAANNSWCSGILRTLAHHTIGGGPRLQLHSLNPEANDRVERAFTRWTKQVNFHEKLLVAKQTQARDGEWFGLCVDDDNVWPMGFNLIGYEADQIASPYQHPTDTSNVDGVRIMANGRPLEYWIRDYHPGDTTFNPTLDGRWYEARHVVHYFRSERPGQVRGVPDITPALPLFALLRRYTLATIHAAESAALFAMFMKSTSAGVNPASSPADFASIGFERNMLNILPEGWDTFQMKPEHPTTTYDMFMRAILNEIARCLSMPYNIAACNSAGYNYSSGRLDHQTYYRAIEIDRHLIEARILTGVLRNWLSAAVYVPGLLDGLPPLELLDYSWQWDAEPTIDENAAANSAATRLQSGQTMLPHEYARSGMDLEKETARTAAFYGVSIEQMKHALFAATYQPPGSPGLQMGQPAAADAAPAGELGSISRQQWSRNRKAIDDVLLEFAARERSESYTREMLLSLGLTEARADALIEDARDGQVDTPVTEEEVTP